VACCFRRFNQRMHTKLILIDDAVGITGGRNYQDDYYDWDGEYSFRDRDVMVAGPVARTMARNFDAFWQARRSVPVERLNDVGRRLLGGVPALPPAVFVHPERVQRLSEEADDEALVGAGRRGHAGGRGGIRCRPAAEAPPRSGAAVDATAPQLDTLIAGARSEILLRRRSYLVLSKPAQALFRSLRQRAQPPRIDVSTSSLAATDNPIVYAVSFKYRRRYMREMGFNIHEYKTVPGRPAAGPRRRAAHAGGRWRRCGRTPAALRFLGHGRSAACGGPDATRVERKVLRTETRPSYLRMKPANRPLPVTRKGVRMGLHAKSMVVDERIAVIGTHNRPAQRNTTTPRVR
jgi:phosphatidylserine/phosphatidylglycerophosphate/cardiolipin synthase-like enzyme